VCGLTGVVLSQPVEAPVFESRLRQMIATLRHRGPDGEGVWADRHAGLAHSRLAVLDLSDAARQPISDAEERAFILLKFRKTADAEPFARRAIAMSGSRETRLRLAFADAFLAAGDQPRALAIIDGMGTEVAAAKRRVLSRKANRRLPTIRRL